MKQRIRLSENELHNIITEAVKTIINEYVYTDADIQYAKRQGRFLRSVIQMAEKMGCQIRRTDDSLYCFQIVNIKNIDDYKLSMRLNSYFGFTNPYERIRINFDGECMVPAYTHATKNIPKI